MGIIERSLIVSGFSKKTRVKALFDSGSSFSIINEKIVKQIKPIKIQKCSETLILGDGRKIKIKERVIYQIYLNKNNYFQKFLVMDIPDQMIIGVDFLQTYGHTLEFKNDTVVSKPMHLKTSRGVYRL